MTPEELDAWAEEKLSEREAQGLPRHVTDPAIIERVAAILGRKLSELGETYSSSSADSPEPSR